VNHLEVVRLPVYRPTEKECADPKLYANNVRTLMAAEVGQLVLDHFYALCRPDFPRVLYLYSDHKILVQYISRCLLVGMTV
jgi:hypothetical protein